MPSKNILKIFDDSNAIDSIEFVGGSIVVTSGKKYDSPPSIQKSGHQFVITFMADRQNNYWPANEFNVRSGTDGNTFAGYSHGAKRPSELNFTFQIKVHFKTVRGNGSMVLNVGQGHVSGRNNWWLGGSSIDGNKKTLNVPLGTGSATTFTLPLSGTVNTFTLSAGSFSEHFPIRHVFVLMLENHSFDNIFAMSGIPGITAATPQANSNVYNGQAYPVASDAPPSMPTDPGHEFLNVLEQVAGESATLPPSGYPYPPVTNSGFVASYAKVRNTPADAIGKIMKCFDTARQLPVIYTLAKNFLLCDHWFSSLPGPTWPNRFFVHGASSNGLDDSPTTSQLLKWSYFEGFTFPHGSIFDALTNSNIPYQVYVDIGSRFAGPHFPDNGGDVAQVGAIKGVSRLKFKDIGDLPHDLADSYRPQYTFIEPNYGDVIRETYRHGSSQHPMDDTRAGEGLIKFVYESIRKSPVWQNSMLLITYDEHGGFYDSQTPRPMHKPNDDHNNPSGLNKHGFLFDLSGIRVPAIAISPWLAAEVDHTIYDHSSALATVEKLFGLAPLTDRDKNANSLVSKLLTSARTDCPTDLPDPVISKTARSDADETDFLSSEMAAQPVPSSGNLVGVLGISLKTELEMAQGDDQARLEILHRFEQIKTRGQACEYVRSVSQKVAAEQAQMRKEK